MDPRFLSIFYGKLKEIFGARLKLSITFHPATDGNTEKVIQTLEDMLQACVLDFGGSWEEQLSLIEFSNNNSHQFSIGMSPYDYLYGRRCQTPIFWDDVQRRVMIGSKMILETMKQVN